MTAGNRFTPRINGRQEQDRPSSLAAGPLGEECRRGQTAILVKSAARARNEDFDPPIFGDPAWEMVLEIYLQESSGRSAIEHLLASQDVPRSTALRWLDFLEQQGLIRRHAALATRTEQVELTERGRVSVERFLDTLRGL